jgi:hypothetical protein
VSKRNSRGATSTVWAILSAVGLLWPSRVLGPLDGAPLSGALEPVVIALLFPVLAINLPNVFDKPTTRAVVLALLLWKLVTPVFLTQQGWTGTFWLPTSQVVPGRSTLERDFVFGGPLPRPPWIQTPPPTWPSEPQGSWDVRARTSGTARRVTAIVDRAYLTLDRFPAWFLNMLDEGRPPHAPFMFDVEGYLAVEAPGALSLLFTPGNLVDVTVDSQQLGRVETGVMVVPIAPGQHHIRIQLTFRGDSWRFVPLWNGQDLWTSVCTTIDSPTWIDRTVWNTARWVTTGLVLLLVARWLSEWLRLKWIRVPGLAWMVGASGAMAIAAQWETLGRLSPLLLFGSTIVPVERRLRNVYGAFLLLGIPWLAFIASGHQFEVGQFTLPALGDDWTRFQRFAHRVYMEGYWLEGGEPTFWWQQPLYRWMIAALHLVFGDSNVGQAYWDGMCLLVSTLFACHIVKAIAGFRWGLVAGAMTLATFALSPIWYLIGRGLSEIAAAGWVYMAAYCLLRARLGRIRWAVAASVFATLAFYTRINHLPFIVVCVVLAFPRQVRDWVSSSRRTAAIAATYFAGLGVGTCLFALRTYYYTGVFSILYGTQRERLSTGLGVVTFFSVDAWQRALESVWTVITIQDPGSLDLRTLAVVVGVATAGLALIRIPPLQRIPLSLAIVCWGALAAPLMTRSSSYTGRASVHLVPVAIAMFVSALAVSVKRWPFQGTHVRTLERSHLGRRTSESAQAATVTVTGIR